AVLLTDRRPDRARPRAVAGSALAGVLPVARRGDRRCAAVRAG
nr:hypothetical protein [Tanacetum cinerariifolium]